LTASTCSLAAHVVSASDSLGVNIAENALSYQVSWPWRHKLFFNGY